MSSFATQRQDMVDQQIAARGVTDPAVLAAMRAVPREAFVEPALAADAYDDAPLPIGWRQTISQPYVVARMIEAVAPRRGDRALEIGTGSGYSAAVLSRLVAEVYTVERLGPLARAARERLSRLGYHNVHVVHGDGTLGLAEHAPYDVIVVTAAGPRVPGPLREQLAAGGRLVMPVGAGRWGQTLVLLTRPAVDRYAEEPLEGVSFVPLIGAEGWPAEGAAVGEPRG